MSDQKANKYGCFEFELKFFLNELPVFLKKSQDCKVIENLYFADTRFCLRTVRTPDGKIVDRKWTQKFVSLRCRSY